MRRLFEGAYYKLNQGAEFALNTAQLSAGYISNTSAFLGRVLADFTFLTDCLFQKEKLGISEGPF